MTNVPEKVDMTGITILTADEAAYILPILDHGIEHMRAQAARLAPGLIRTVADREVLRAKSWRDAVSTRLGFPPPPENATLSSSIAAQGDRAEYLRARSLPVGSNTTLNLEKGRRHALVGPGQIAVCRGAAETCKFCRDEAA